MRIIAGSLVALAALASVTPVFAQEVIVTAQRRSPSDYNGGYANGIVATQRSIINLKRKADYVVQSVRLTGDTRDATVRMNDINATLRAMIAGAPKAGVELATGDYIVEPLTTTNYRNLTYGGDGRPDTSTTTFLVKVKLTPDMPSGSTPIGKLVAGSIGKVASPGKANCRPNGVGSPSMSSTRLGKGVGS